MITTQQIQCDGSSLEVKERKGQSPAIIFIHGSSMSGKSWEKQLHSSILNGHQLLAIDLPGHGNSSHLIHPELHYTIPAYAKTLQNMIDQLKIPQYILVGWSMGGNISLEALHDSNGCVGIFLLATSIIGKPAALDQIFLPHPGAAHLFKEKCSTEELDQLISSLFAANYGPKPNLFYEDFKKADPKFRSTLINSVADGQYEDEIEIVKKATVPIAYALGTGDQLANLSYLQSLNLPFWRGAIQFVKDAGHMPQWENPAQFNSLLEEFVKG